MNINQMNASLLGLFSGFPTHHFPDEIAQVLRENLSRRESLVFISAWPEEYARNDDDSDGMHGMFAERGMAFDNHRVIDRRTSAADAVRLAREADCIFLMGGDITLQMALICDLGLVPELRASRAVLLGVSAGAMNMGRYAADVWETKALCEGIGLTDIVMKGHYAGLIRSSPWRMKAQSLSKPTLFGSLARSIGSTKAEPPYLPMKR